MNETQQMRCSSSKPANSASLLGIAAVGGFPKHGIANKVGDACEPESRIYIVLDDIESEIVGATKGPN